MATYKALIKTVPTGSAFEVTTESGSISTAKQQIEKLYDPIYIHNLREVSGGSSLSDAGDFGGMLMLCLILFGIWLIVEYWWIVIPSVIILGILYYFATKDD